MSFWGTRLLLCYLNRRKKWLLGAAAGTLLVGGLVYETSALLGVFVVVILWMSGARWRHLRLPLLAVFVPEAIVALLHVLARSQAPAKVGVEFTANLAPSAVIPTWIDQTVMAIPGAFAMFTSGLPGYTRSFVFSDLRPLPVAAGVITVVAVGLSIRQASQLRWRILGKLALGGICLWFIPGLVVAVVVRWQQELVFGFAYIPVAISAFGFGLVGAAAILALTRLLRRGWVGRVLILQPIAMGIIALIVGLGAYTSAADNNQLVGALNGWKASIDVLRNAHDHQLFTGRVSVLYAPQQQVWLSSCNRRLVFLQKMSVVGPPPETLPQHNHCLLDRTKLNIARADHVISVGAIAPDQGAALLLTRSDTRQPPRSRAMNARAFVTSPDLNIDQDVVIARSVASQPAASAAQTAVTLNTKDLIAQGNSWFLARAHFPQGCDASTVQVVVDGTVIT